MCCSAQPECYSLAYAAGIPGIRHDTNSIAAQEPVVTSRLRSSPDSTARSLLVTEQRLAVAERELRIELSRIAWEHAELESLLAALRRATDAYAMSVRVECLRLNSALDAATS
jgi:hypothetical protein